MEAKKNGDPILVRGNGEQRRDFIHVHDVADALVEVAAQRPTNALIDIGTGVSYSLNEIAALFDCEIIREPELSGYAECTLADASKTETEINWVAHHNLIDWLNYLYR
jgi:UDP-glucose 4-epimerase